MPLEQVRRRQPGPGVRVDFLVRSQHVEYLEYVAERDQVSLSAALTTVLDENLIGFSRPAGGRRSGKERLHLYIPAHHLALLDRLAVMTGLSRTDAAMRVIEAALQSDRPKKLAASA